MIGSIYKHFKKLSFYVSTGFILVGCATQGVSPEEIAQQIRGFSLPQTPHSKKALVYCIYRADEPLIFIDKVALYYAPSTAEKFENYGSKGALSLLLDIFTLGLTKDSPSLEKNFIGGLEAGEYRTIQLDPGYYEFKRRLVMPDNHISDEEAVVQVKLEADKVYFIELNGYTFYNRYTRTEVKGIYIKEIIDPLMGKYILSKNFRHNKEK